MPKRIIDSNIFKSIQSKMELGLTNKTIASELCISYSIVAKITAQISKGGTEKTILKKRIINNRSNSRNILHTQISEILIRDPALTQIGVQKELELLGYCVSQSKISRIIKKIGFTRKNLILAPIERNSHRVKEIRFNYAREISVFAETQLIFIDETGFNLHVSPSKGYSPINTKAVITVPANRGVNLSLMCAISKNGLVGFRMIDGSYNGNLFIEFINESLYPYFQSNSGSILIMDNCKFHHRRDVIAILNEKRIAYKFLPPYTPMLNPIEEFFGVVKARYRSKRPLVKNKEEIYSRVQDILQNFETDLSGFFIKASSFINAALGKLDFI